MPSKGQVRLKDIKKMLKKCCGPDYGWHETDHHIHVSYNGETFRNLPKGGHDGKGEIERPWVRKMARHLGITDCAKRELPALY